MYNQNLHAMDHKPKIFYYGKAASFKFSGNTKLPTPLFPT